MSNTTGANLKYPISKSQQYINDLVKKLEEAKCELDDAKARKNKFKMAYDNCRTLRDQYRIYYSNIYATYEFAKEVEKSRGSMLTNADKSGMNIDALADAIKIIIVKVKAASFGVEDLKTLIKNLMDKIACLPDQVLVSTDPMSFMALMKDLQDKTTTALNDWLEVIKTSLNVLGEAELLYEMIYGFKDDTHSNEGLVIDLAEMGHLLKNGERSTWPLDTENFYSTDDKDLDCEITIPPPKPLIPCPLPAACLMIGREIPEDPTKSLPEEQDAVTSGTAPEQQLAVSSSTDPDCDSPYFKALKERFNNTNDWADFWKLYWDCATSMLENAQSQYDAVNRALTAARDTKKC